MAGDPLGRPTRRLVTAVTGALPALVALGLVLVVWQVVAVHNSDVVPTVGQVATSLVDHPRSYAENLVITLEEMAVGLGASALVAFSLAVVMVHVRLLERAVMPLAVVLNVTPVVAFAPALVIALGFGMAPRYVVTGVIVFFPLLVNGLVGLRNVDPEALDYLRTLRASTAEILFRLRIPSSLPFVFAAARISVPLGLVGAVVAEFEVPGQDRGLGSLIAAAFETSDLAVVYTAILCLALLGLVLTGVLVALERRALSWWHPARR